MDCGEVELWSRLEFGFRDASGEVEDSEGLEVWSSQERWDQEDSIKNHGFSIT